MRTTILKLIVLTACGCGKTPIAEHDPLGEPGKIVVDVLGKKNVMILRNPDRVEVYRLDPDPNAKGENRIEGHAVVFAGQQRDKAFACKLSAVLLKEQTYMGRAYKCFDPGVGFRIWSGESFVDVAICFHCANLKINDHYVEFAGKHGIYKQLGDLAKEAFPNDGEIQKIPESCGLDER